MDIKTTHTVTITDAERDLLTRAVLNLHESLRHRIEHAESLNPETFAASIAAHREDIEALNQLYATLMAR